MKNKIGAIEGSEITIVRVKKAFSTKILSKLTFEVIGRKLRGEEMEQEMYLVNGVYQTGLPVFIGVPLLRVRVRPHKTFGVNNLRFKENELSGMEYLIKESSLEDVE